MLGLEINDSLSAGEIIVGVGTLALAGFTWHLASDTNALDERNAGASFRKACITLRAGALKRRGAT